MSASDVIKHLTLHDCPNVTTKLNLPLCQDKPTYGGGFSDVYKGNLLSGIPVAIKCLRLSSTATDHNSKVHKHAAHELYTWSKLKHANVLELLGLALFRGQIAMVSPWMNQGDLCSYAIRHPDASRCELCTQVINGLAYMHSQGVIHGDLKAANVLVSFDGIAKLADFGCTTLKQDSTVQFTRTGTVNFSLRWAAPELLTDEGSASVASDVYALAMTIMEVVSGRIPYYNKRDTVVMNLVVLAKVTPERPEEISTDSEEGNSLWRLLQSCWRYDPVGRPTVAEIGKLVRARL
ncbi:kinase-like protein [Ceratobasidium sp. AG-I]|nr:kinase-like protein [Ceratobasidium sp. AG-I]